MWAAVFSCGQVMMVGSASPRFRRCAISSMIGA
jgi:hypothetical protein